MVTPKGCGRISTSVWPSCSLRPSPTSRPSRRPRAMATQRRHAPRLARVHVAQRRAGTPWTSARFDQFFFGLVLSRRWPRGDLPRSSATPRRRSFAAVMTKLRLLRALAPGEVPVELRRWSRAACSKDPAPALRIASRNELASEVATFSPTARDGFASRPRCLRGRSGAAIWAEVVPRCAPMQPRFRPVALSRTAAYQREGDLRRYRLVESAFQRGKLSGFDLIQHAREEQWPPLYAAGILPSGGARAAAIRASAAPAPAARPWRPLHRLLHRRRRS